jgi:hypothetical protein
MGLHEIKLNSNESQIETQNSLECTRSSKFVQFPTQQIEFKGVPFMQFMIFRLFLCTVFRTQLRTHACTGEL